MLISCFSPDGSGVPPTATFAKNYAQSRCSNGQVACWPDGNSSSDGALLLKTEIDDGECDAPQYRTLPSARRSWRTTHSKERSGGSSRPSRQAGAHYSGGQPRPSSDRVLRALFLLPETHAADDAVTADFGCGHACGGTDNGSLGGSRCRRDRGRMAGWKDR